MARRESQGLQIALISFVILTILLLLTTYYFFSRSQSLAEEATTAQSDAQQNMSAARSAEDALNKARTFLGYESTVGIETIESNYNQDKLVYGQGIDDAAFNYRGLVEYLQGIIGQKNVQLNKNIDDLKRLTAEVQSVRASEAEVSGQHKKALDETTQELANVRIKSDQDVRTAAQTAAQVRQQLTQTQGDLSGQIQEKTRQIEELTAQIEDMKGALELRDREIAGLQKESLDRPDGKIISANPGSGRVLINLGRADGLRPQIRFTVFEARDNNLATAVKKGAIEVTSIVDRNLASAKILPEEGDLRNPIIEGDILFSPLWDRGGKLRFALVGAMDVNDDGVDDRDEIRDMIRISGGIIDAEDVDGEINGRITTNTRYLVHGARPTDTGDEAERNSYVKLMDDAARMGVEQISVRKLANYVGFRGRRRAIPMGEGARGEDFRPLPTSSRNYTRY